MQPKRLEGYTYAPQQYNPQQVFAMLQAQQAMKNRPAPKQKGKGGFLSSIISELGGAGGAAGGAAAGAALGSVVPGAGTLIGGLIGAGIGGFGGATAGRGVENKIRDNQNFLGAGGSARAAFGEGALTGALSGLGTGVSALRGVKAVGGLKGLSSAAGGSDDALKAMSKQLLTGGKKAGVRIAGGDTTGKIAQAGNSLRSGVINPKVAASPFGATKEAEIAASLSGLGLKGSAKNQYKQMPGVFNKLSSQIDDALAVNTSTSNLSKLTGSIKKTTKDLPQFINGDELYTKSLTNELRDLTSKFGSSKITAAQLQAAKSDLSSKMGTIFPKIAKGADLNPKEASRLAIWRGLDDHIVSIAPEVKALTSQQAKLYEAAPGLLTASKKTLGVPLLGVKSGAAERVVQGGQDLAGRALQKVGGLGTATGGALSQIKKQGLMQAPGNLVDALSQPPQAPEQSEDEQLMALYEQYSGGAGQDPMMGQGMMDPMMEQPQQSAYSQEAVMSDIQRDPKNASTYLKLYETFNQAPKAAKGPSAATQKQDALVYTGSNAVQNLRSMFQKDPSLIAKTGVPGRNILGIGNRALGLGEYEAMAQQAIDSVARLRTGAAMTPSEETFYRRMVPQAGDNQQTINQKLDELERYFGTFQTADEGSESQDLTDALMQMQQGAY